MASKKISKVKDEWVLTAHSENVPADVVSLIERRRRQMLVHSYIYYKLDDNLISDHEWMRMAQELAALQKTYGTQFGFFDDEFANWDGSSGYQLSYTPGPVNTALRLLARRTKGDV